MSPLPEAVFKALVELQARCADANLKLMSVSIDQATPTDHLSLCTFTTAHGPLGVFLPSKGIDRDQ